MATVYSAVISVIHLLEHIKLHNSHHQPFFPDTQFESLKELVIFFQEFLEGYSHGDSTLQVLEGLESRMVDAAHSAEDIIETYVVDEIHLRSKKLSAHWPQGVQKMNNFVTNHRKKRSLKHLSRGLQRIVKEMDLIKKELMEIQDKCRLKNPQPRESPEQKAEMSSSSLPSGKVTLVRDEDLYNILDKLTGGESNRQVIAITGMGGIGKSTLAKHVYDNLVVVQHFDVRGWITISQQYDARQLILCLLEQFRVGVDEKDMKMSGYHHFGEKLHKHLAGRRYLVVMDDIWNVEVWDKLKLFLPDYRNGSRVMATTRISNVASNLGSCHIYPMNLLDGNKSWESTL